MIKSLASELNAFEQDHTSPVAILCGIGGNFSVGYDFEEIAEDKKADSFDLQNFVVKSKFTVM